MKKEEVKNRNKNQKSDKLRSSLSWGRVDKNKSPENSKPKNI